MNIVIKNRFILIILFLFIVLQDFAIRIGEFVVPYHFFAILLFISYCFIRYNNLVLTNLKKLYNTKTGKYLTFFIIWIILGVFVSILTGNFIPKSFFSNFLGNFLCSNLFPFLIPALIVPFFIEYKKLCKFLIILYFCVFTLGIIEYIANTYDITFIQNLFSTIVNRVATKTETTRVFVIAYNKFRISGIFQEPGGFAAFIFISLPLVYFLCTSKTMWLKNRVMDYIIKISTLILMPICLIGTQSPINLCFVLIFLGFIFVKKIITIKIKHKAIILLSCLGITALIAIMTINILSLKNIDITDTYLNRIVKVIDTFRSMTLLVAAEPSLATRIGKFSGAFTIALKHPIFGIGFGNIMKEWPNAVLSLPFTITPELFNDAILKRPTAAGVMFWKLSAETGFIGTILFYLFLANIAYTAQKIKKYYTGYLYNLINNLQLSLILYICVSYYIFLQPFMWVYIGLLESMILHYKIFKAKSQIDMINKYKTD